MSASPTCGWTRPSAEGAEVLVTSCPYCITTSRTRLVHESCRRHQVKDITEIIQEVI